MYVCIYIYIDVCVHIYIYIYVYYKHTQHPNPETPKRFASIVMHWSGRTTSWCQMSLNHCEGFRLGPEPVTVQLARNK